MNKSVLAAHVTAGDAWEREDPRDALLRYAKVAEEDPRFVATAYKKTQPQTILASRTLEEERDEVEQERKRLRGGK